MKSKLDLTSDQEPQIAAINLKYAQKADPIIKGSSGSLMKMHQMNKINLVLFNDVDFLVSNLQLSLTSSPCGREEMRRSPSRRSAP